MSTPGVEFPSITVDLVREYLKKDLSVAISCLNAIQSDPDCMEMLAVFLTGRWQNDQSSKSRVHNDQN